MATTAEPVAGFQSGLWPVSNYGADELRALEAAANRRLTAPPDRRRRSACTCRQCPVKKRSRTSRAA